MGAGTAQRAVEQLGEAEVPARLVSDGLAEPPEKGVVTVTRGVLCDGFAAPGLGLLVLTESDLTGNRVATGEPRKLAARRRNAVELETLKPGDYVVHSQHGIGRFVEMRERTVSGAKREYLVLEYASSKRGQPADRLFVPTDQLDEVKQAVLIVYMHVQAFTMLGDQLVHVRHNFPRATSVNQLIVSMAFLELTGHSVECGDADSARQKNVARAAVDEGKVLERLGNRDLVAYF